MTSILVRDIDPTTLRALMRLARSHNRSLQAEVHAILDRAAWAAPHAVGKRRIRLVTVPVGGDSTWDRNSLYR
ncbi:MAG: hypothetical protein OXN89_14490 [Bryobacterales bacterium]|nr:hypothetical protein [Bryobacterales bacterium]